MKAWVLVESSAGGGGGPLGALCIFFSLALLFCIVTRVSLVPIPVGLNSPFVFLLLGRTVAMYWMMSSLMGKKKTLPPSESLHNLFAPGQGVDVMVSLSPSADLQVTAEDAFDITKGRESVVY